MGQWLNHRGIIRIVEEGGGGMDPEQIKEELKKEAKRLHIDKIGFASAEPFLELKERLIRHRQQGMSRVLKSRIWRNGPIPQKILPEAKSIIAIALAYPLPDDEPTQVEARCYRGIFCRASWGGIITTCLRETAGGLEGSCRLAWFRRFRGKVLVDTGPLSDRAVAERAGIGWVGKNTALITDEFGSWVYLGEMITDVYLPPDTPVTEGCGDCTACLDACPTGALVRTRSTERPGLSGLFDPDQAVWCRSPIREKIGNRLYGCDTCQVVCPYNRKVNFTHQREFAPGSGKGEAPAEAASA